MLSCFHHCPFSGVSFVSFDDAKVDMLRAQSKCFDVKGRKTAFILTGVKRVDLHQRRWAR